jgi:hypothetical protein
VWYLELTSEETEVALLAGKGLSDPEIAAGLFISKAVEGRTQHRSLRRGINRHP